jgi:hypothetical protein
MRVVLAALAVKVVLAVATRAGRLARAVLRAKSSSGLPTPPNSVPSTEKWRPLTLSCDSTAARNWAAISPSTSQSRFLVKVVASHTGFLDAEPDKPAEQQVVVDPLDQLPLRADRIERLQQQCAHQPLRRDGLPADRRIELGELARQQFERRIGTSRITRSG